MIRLILTQLKTELEILCLCYILPVVKKKWGPIFLVVQAINSSFSRSTYLWEAHVWASDVVFTLHNYFSVNFAINIMLC